MIPSGYVKIAIDHGPVEIVDLPIEKWLVGGLEHVLFSHILGTIIPID